MYRKYLGTLEMQNNISLKLLMTFPMRLVRSAPPREPDIQHQHHSLEYVPLILKAMIKSSQGRNEVFMELLT